jgi:nucleoside-diphosphate-sugar epimerase
MILLGPSLLEKEQFGGYSPRMRFDLVVNAMTKTALSEGKIIVNNPAIWRPLVDIRDVVSAYVRSIEADLSVSGVYNILEENYTIGRLADEIKLTLESQGHQAIVRN